MQENNGMSSNTGETTEMTKDTLIFVKSKSVGEDSKGRTKLDLRFSEEETAQLKEELSSKIRAKLQIHYSEETAFLFVKEVQPKGETFRAKKTAVVTPVANASAASKIAALKTSKTI